MPTPLLIQRPRAVFSNFLGGNTINAAMADGSGNLYCVSTGHFFGYDMKKGSILNKGNGATITGTLSQHVAILVGYGSAMTAGSTSNVYQLVELSSNYVTTSGTVWTTSPAGNRPQTLVFNSAASAAMMVGSGSTGKVAILDCTTMTATVPTVSGHSTDGIRCVIPMGSSTHFLVGTTSGSVIELDRTGATIGEKSLVPPSSSVCIANVGSGTLGTYIVNSLAYSGDTVLASVSAGLIYNIKWSTKTIVETVDAGETGDGITAGGVTLHEQPSNMPNNTGQVFWTRYGNSASTPNDFNNVYLTLAQISFTGKVRKLGTIRMEQASPPSSLGYDPTLQMLWFTRNNTAKLQLLLYGTAPYSTTTVPTRVQNPPGTDVSARIIRIADPGLGRAYVYSDTNVAAGQQSLQATATSEYYELAIIGNTLWDWRKFNV